MFNTFTRLCDHHGLVNRPKRNPRIYQQPLPSPLPSPWQSPGSFLSPWMHRFRVFPINEITERGLLCLASFTRRHVCKVYPCCSMDLCFIPFHARIIFHNIHSPYCIYSILSMIYPALFVRPCFVYSFISGCASGLFPPPLGHHGWAPSMAVRACLCFPVWWN